MFCNLLVNEHEIRFYAVFFVFVCMGEQEFVCLHWWMTEKFVCMFVCVGEQGLFFIVGYVCY